MLNDLWLADEETEAQWHQMPLLWSQSALAVGGWELGCSGGGEVLGY